MYRTLFWLLGVMAVVLWVTMPAQAQDSSPIQEPQAVRTWTIMGDSWGALLLDPTKDEFQQRGLTNVAVLQTSIPGSTAAMWAANVNGILDVVKTAVAISPPNPVVYVSLGGNDLIQGYISQGNAVFDQIETDLRTISTELTSVRPDVTVVFAAYDILKMDKSLFCLVSAQLFFNSFLPWDVNPLFFEIGRRQAEIGAEHPQVVYTNVWGTLQGHTGFPNPLLWSPGTYFPDDELDCVHLNEEGYRLFIDAVLDKLIGAD